MITILTTIDHPNVLLPDKDITIYDYYMDTIQPYLIRRGYQADYSPCDQVWDTLLQQPPDIFLMFLMINIEWEDSCCIHLARRIYHKWPVTNDPPIRILHFEWKDTDDLANLRAVDQIVRPQEPLYYDPQEPLYYAMDLTNWEVDVIAGGIAGYLSQHSFDEQLFSEKLQTLLGPQNTAWSLFTYQHVCHYYLMHVEVDNAPGETMQYFIWNRAQILAPLKEGIKEFIDLIDRSNVQLIFHLDDMFFLFSYMVKKHIIHWIKSPDEPLDRIFGNFRDLGDEYETYGDLIPPEKHDILRQYAALITSPMLWHNEQEQQAQFWTIDASTPILKKWILIQKNGKLLVHTETIGPMALEGFDQCLEYAEIPIQYFFHNSLIVVSDEPFTLPQSSA